MLEKNYTERLQVIHMRQKKYRLETIQQFRSYESSLATIYTKLVSLEKGIANLRQTWNNEQQEGQNYHHGTKSLL